MLQPEVFERIGPHLSDFHRLDVELDRLLLPKLYESPCAEVWSECEDLSLERDTNGDLMLQLSEEAHDQLSLLHWSETSSSLETPPPCIGFSVRLDCAHGEYETHYIARLTDFQAERWPNSVLGHNIYVCTAEYSLEIVHTASRRRRSHV